MRQLTPCKFTAQILVLLPAILLCTAAGHSQVTDVITEPVPGLNIVLEPQISEIQVGQTVLVRIFADSATDLISMGVRVSFNPEVLRAVGASKNNNFYTGWVMDADGDPSTTGDQYTSPAVQIDNVAGIVTMIGGRLMDSNTTGLTGKVLLGRITFKGISSWDANLFVDVARYHPNHPNETFDNFVCLDGTVDEPVNVPGILGRILVGEKASEGLVDVPVVQSSSSSTSDGSISSDNSN